MKRPLLIFSLLFLLSGCVGGLGQIYPENEVGHMPKWQALHSQLAAYQKIACPSCGQDDWKLSVIKTEEINAFFWSGQFFVTDGLLDLPFEMQSAVLAHEISHQVAGHILLSQEHELEADRIAIWLMERTRGDVSGADDLKQVLRLLAGKWRDSSETISAHPHPNERIDQIEKIQSDQIQAFKPEFHSRLAQISEEEP